VVRWRNFYIPSAILKAQYYFTGKKKLFYGNLILSPGKIKRIASVFT